MKSLSVCCVGSSPASQFAREHLKDAGAFVTATPSHDTEHLLLDVPSFLPGSLFSDPQKRKSLLSSLPGNVKIFGGNLTHDSLRPYTTIDFLKDEIYLASNAAVTADCAIKVAAPLLHCTFQNCPVLVIGWGRIGKCLGKVLQSMGAQVTISARQPAQLACLTSLGYDTADTNNLIPVLNSLRLVFNTVPEMVLPAPLTQQHKHCVFIDLASTPGIEGENVHTARGLPGKYAPETSGQLIADTFLRLYREDML